MDKLIVLKRNPSLICQKKIVRWQEKKIIAKNMWIKMLFLRMIKAMKNDDPVQDSNIENDSVNQSLVHDKSNSKKSEDQQNFISEGECKRYPLDQDELKKNPDLKTLDHALEYFELSPVLEELETSLEDVRRNKKNKVEHEEFFKQIDKKIQKLSLKYHPDKIKNRGCAEEKITAEKLQAALNGTRTVLKLLNSAFIEDIGTHQKFRFYTDLNVNSLCNEDEIKNHIYEVMFKIEMISRIMQKNIISQIRKFLNRSKICIDSYLVDRSKFEKHRDLALFHLECCIEGFEKLCVELEEAKEQCKSEKNGRNMHSVMEKMASDSRRDLKLLKSLDKKVKSSLKGNYQFFCPEEFMDPYFVLPLVSYTNVILMCNTMVRRSSLLDWLNFYSEFNPCFRIKSNPFPYSLNLYYLASYYSGDKYYEKEVSDFINKTQPEYSARYPISKKEIESVFPKYIKEAKESIENEFKIENYSEVFTTNSLILDLKKCTTIMAEFREKEQELSKDIVEFQKKAKEEMDERCERFDKIREKTEELHQKMKEMVQQRGQSSEKVSNAFSDQ